MIYRMNMFAFLGPLTIIAAIAGGGYVYPGYSHAGQFISELGTREAPSSLIMNLAGFMAFGVMIILFHNSTLVSFPKRVSIGIAQAFMLLSGIMIVVMGICPCDKGCSLVNMSLDAKIHNASAVLAFSGAIVSQIAVGVNAFRRRDSDIYYRTSLVAGLISVSVYAAIIVTGQDYPYRGTLQRLFLLNYCLWFMMSGVFGRKRISMKTGGQPG